jgi:hypothetical protein
MKCWHPVARAKNHCCGCLAYEDQCQQTYPAPGWQQTLTHLADGLRWHEDLHTQSIQALLIQSEHQTQMNKLKIMGKPLFGIRPRRYF